MTISGSSRTGCLPRSSLRFASSYSFVRARARSCRGTVVSGTVVSVVGRCRCRGRTRWAGCDGLIFQCEQRLAAGLVRVGTVGPVEVRRLPCGVPVDDVRRDRPDVIVDQLRVRRRPTGIVRVDRHEDHTRRSGELGCERVESIRHRRDREPDFVRRRFGDAGRVVRGDVDDLDVDGIGAFERGIAFGKIGVVTHDCVDADVVRTGVVRVDVHRRLHGDGITEELQSRQGPHPSTV